MQQDIKWMRRALALARRGWGRTSPNPMVGAVLVRDGVEIGAGWHQCAGGPHAEAAVLAATQDAAGATIYVTLEPCCTHGRTPPCTDALLSAGVSRVVIGCADPNPKHAGRGVDILRDAGIEVQLGVLEEPCRRLNEAFFCWVRHGRPMVLLKLAVTLDGRIATASGQSQWITGPASHKRVQRLRQWADAIMVGGETVRCDDPQLLVRSPGNWQRQPLRLIASRSGDLGVSPQVLTDGRARTRIVSCADADEWRDLFQNLGDEGITAVLVEGGGELAASLLDAGVVDKLALFLAPILLGGRNSRPAVGGADPACLADGFELSDSTVTRSGNDFLIEGYLTDVLRNC